VVGFRSAASTVGDEVNVTVEFNLTDAASIGACPRTEASYLPYPTTSMRAFPWSHRLW